MRFVWSVAMLAACGVIKAQEPERIDSPVPGIVMSELSEPRICPVGCGHHIGGDVLIGLPTALRVEIGVAHREHYTLAIDGLFGAAVSQDDAASVIGLGPRWIWNVFSDDRANAFQANPGCYFLAGFGSSRNSGTSLIVAPTIDFAFIHDFQNRSAFRGGVELGAGYGTRGDWYPLVALFAGLQF